MQPSGVLLPDALTKNASPVPQLNVGVVFGGVSPEHEVSIISALQAAHALDRSRYRPVPLYIAKSGDWYAGDILMDLDAYQDLDALQAQAVPVLFDPGAFGQLAFVEKAEAGLFARAPQRFVVDVLLLGLHGGAGESGALQGVCEVFNVPYTGSGVFGSALGMDKVFSKMICRDAGLPIVDFVAFRDSDWGYHEEAWLDRCEAELGYPVIVKPARLGSSIGIAKADTREELDAAIEEALRYDPKVVIEQAVHPLREINCSVLGNPDEALASVLEEPVASDDARLLSFQDKYMRGGGGSKGEARGTKQGGSEGMASLDRIIPAPLSEEQTQEIRDLGVQLFRLFECSGVARIDFMLNADTGQVYFNEINTIPGSFSFYLWEPTGVSFTDLTHRLIELARQRHRDQNSRVRSYDVNLLAAGGLSGIKGAKG